ncbi:MAG: DUF1624 domain-containing protein [Alphaproteobacteria bacterium]|nr:DUF1624 domain-containing protein [Alphaproteobacteria bacterium]
MSQMRMADAGQAAPIQRFEWIDALRGLSLLAMFAYHLIWDLAFYGLITREIPLSPAFKLFGHAIAASFLTLVGMSLVLAHHKGWHWPAFWRRLAWLILASAAISLVTYILFPSSFIFFGILHCIAVISLLAVPVLNLPVLAIWLLALLTLLLPAFAAAPHFDQPLLWWTGLGLDQPESNDWRPLFPWGGFAFLGLALMRQVQNWDLLSQSAHWRAKTRLSRLLVWGGQHSLAVYLIHQPIFLGLVFLLAQGMGSIPMQAEDRLDLEARPFMNACQNQCVSARAEASTCQRLCACVVDELRSSGLWRESLTRPLTEMEQQRVQAMSRQCSRGEKNDRN